MDFTTIGTVGSYIKQKNLNFAANYKLKTGQRVTDANGNLQFAKSNMFDQMLKANKKSDSDIDAAKIASIKQKLMSGKKLSTSEMAYLKEKDSKLYKKAKHTEEAREELQSELKKAKTKQEARQAVTQAMVKASAEASAELAAYKNGLSAGGGEISTAGYQAGTEVSGDIAGAEISTEETPSMIQVNEEISADGEQMTEAAAEVTKLEIQANQNVAENIQQANSESAESSKTQQDSSTEKNSSGKTTADDILEKFIMTIRALEDEWAKFSNSKEFKKLPEDYIQDDEKVINKSNKKTLDAISAYRNAMKF